MSRLDRHVSAVQTRMALGTFLKALAWAGMVYAIIVWTAILLDRLVQVRLPRQIMWFWIGLGVMVAVSLAYTIWRRPTAREAAVAIDEKLSLKEKFSTALYVRPSKDPFAVAAVYDAEKTAEKVDLHKKFPVQWPKALGGTATAALVVLATLLWFPRFDLFGMEAKRQQKAQAEQIQQAQAHESIRKAIARIEAAPKAVTDKQEIRLALADLKKMSERPPADSTHAQQKAQQALENLDKAIKQRIEANKEFAIAQNEAKQMRNLEPPKDETGAIADAHRAMSQAKFEEAVQKLDEAVKNFDKMTEKEKQKSAEQMKNLAQALKQMANDPAKQQEMQKQLQQMGANQQQAQQIQQMMQQAANGDKNAQQQLQQMAKQMAQQMNQQMGGTPQQQMARAQQIQQMMQKMQQQANAQNGAQQLSQSAQAMAKAMQQAAQQGGQQNGQNQQGQKGQGQNQQKQQMANAAQKMQQQLQQMQAIANDAMAAGADGQDGENGQNQGNNGQGQQQGQNRGQMARQQQQQNGQGNNQGPVGVGGLRPNPQETPFSVKDERDPSQLNEKGKILASTFVKAGSIKGDSKIALHDVVPSVEKEATDEVGEERIPRGDQAVVRDYFATIKRDTEKK